MPYYQNDDIFILVGGYNLIGDGDRIDALQMPDATAEIEDTTGLGTQVPIHKATGHKSYEDITFDGWLDDSSDSINTRLEAGLSTASRIFMAGDAGKVAGDPFHGGTIKDFQYKRTPRPKLLQRAGGALRVTGPVHQGVILKSLGAVTADGDTQSASEDLGATAVTITSSSVASPSVITTASAHGLETGDDVLIAGHTGSTPDINGEHEVTVLTPTTFSIATNVTVGGTGGTMRRIRTPNGAWIYSEISALTLGGYDDVEVEHWDSDDDAIWVSMGSKQYTTAPDADRQSVAGDVERYTAVSWTFNGSGSGPSATIIAGVARNPAS